MEINGEPVCKIAHPAPISVQYSDEQYGNDRMLATQGVERDAEHEKLQAAEKCAGAAP
jgi:hypothetical protein